MAEAELLELSLEACLALLRGTAVGHLGFVVDEWPIVVPVNYRMVEVGERRWLALRTRPGSIIDRAPFNVAFEVDGIDAAHRGGWSVVVRGTLHHVDADAAGFRERFDPEPWILAERDSWLIIDPVLITGRQLRGAEPEWAFLTEADL